MINTQMPALWGLLLGASLYLSLGPQNLFILRQGMAGRHVFAACGVAALSDALLVGLGIAGLGPLILGVPAIARAVALLAAAIVLWMGFAALLRFLRPRSSADIALDLKAPLPLRRVLATASALSLLNPQAHADLVLLIGGFAANYAWPARVEFGLGAAASGVIWLFLLGFTAARLQGLLRRPRVARLIDLATAVLMLTAAAANILTLARS